jgi:hypothetical protein
MDLDSSNGAQVEKLLRMEMVLVEAVKAAANTIRLLRTGKCTAAHCKFLDDGSVRSLDPIARWPRWRLELDASEPYRQPLTAVRVNSLHHPLDGQESKRSDLLNTLIAGSWRTCHACHIVRSLTCFVKGTNPDFDLSTSRCCPAKVLWDWVNT